MAKCPFGTDWLSSARSPHWKKANAPATTSRVSTKMPMRKRRAHIVARPIGRAGAGQACRWRPPPLSRRTMSVSPEQVRHIAKLARIAMSDEELDRLLPELNNILGWVEQLGEVDTDGVEPLATVIDQKLRLRDDVVNDGNIRDAILANAPEAQHGFFAVPEVIE